MRANLNNMIQHSCDRAKGKCGTCSFNRFYPNSDVKPCIEYLLELLRRLVVVGNIRHEKAQRVEVEKMRQTYKQMMA